MPNTKPAKSSHPQPAANFVAGLASGANFAAGLAPIPTRLVFDWNGTLLDDAAACHRAFAAMRAGAGLAPMDYPTYRARFGFPLIDFYRATGFDVEDDAYPALADQFMRAYAAELPTLRLFDDALPLLRQLRRDGFRLAILSAYRHSRLLEAAAQYGVAEYFERIIGLHNDDAGSKRHLLPGLLEEWGAGGGGPAGSATATAPTAAKIATATIAETLFVGDTLHDLETAASVGMRCALVSRGHQMRERLEGAGAIGVFGSLAELGAALEAARS
jgi:phosphoglycolate phosphatase